MMVQKQVVDGRQEVAEAQIYRFDDSLVKLSLPRVSTEANKGAMVLPMS